MRGGHRCFICGAKMEPYFSKTFKNWGVSTLDYDVCTDCGFAICQTLIDMPTADWVELNERFHTEIYKHPGDPFNRAGRLRGQGDAISRLIEGGIIPSDRPLVDWGSGVGDLAIRMLERRHLMYSYDKYITPLVNPYPGEPAPRSCSFVIAAAVYEHLMNREQMDSIEELVADDGVLAIHMVIPKTIPKDPEWVYLLPVHCAFYTCESMRRLMIDWGYSASIYCREADTWFLVRKADGLAAKVAAINAAHGYDYLVFSDAGFVGKDLIEYVGATPEAPRYLYVGTAERDLGAGWTVCKWDGIAPFVESAQRLTPGSYDGVYSDAVIEQIKPVELQQYAAAVKSLLKPRGVHRLATIDMDAMITNAASGTWKTLAWVKAAGITTRSEYLNTSIRSKGRRHVYDADNVKKALHRTGHHNIAKHGFRKGRVAALSAADTENHRLYFEAAF